MITSKSSPLAAGSVGTASPTNLRLKRPAGDCRASGASAGGDAVGTNKVSASAAVAVGVTVSLSAGSASVGAASGILISAVGVTVTLSSVGEAPSLATAGVAP